MVLAMRGMRRYPGTSDFDAIKRSTLPTNARSDTGDLRIVLHISGGVYAAGADHKIAMP